MADRNLSFRVSATDDASATFSKIAQASKREMGKVQKDQDDTASSGQKMARLLSSMADELDDEFRKVEQAAERLGDALGPELAAKVNPESIVQDFRRAGLTFEEIEADADQLAQSIARIEQVSDRAGAGVRKSMSDAADGLDRVRDSGDQSRSVIANMAGNATSELPGIASALGPVNVAMGQLAEYAADGNIKLRNMVGLGAGMAAITGVLAGINSQMEAAAKSKAFDRERINNFRKAILDTGSAASVLREEMEDTGKVMVEFGRMGEVDIVPSLDAIGLSVDRFTELAGRSEEEIRSWAEQMKAAGADAGNVDAVVIGLADTHANLADAQEAAAITNRVLGETTEDTTRSLEENTAALARSNERLRRNIDLFNERNDAMRESANTNLALRDAIDSADDSLAEYNATVAEHGAASEEADDASRALEAAYLRVGEAAAREAETQATAAGRASTAVAEGQQAQAQSLFNLAQGLSPGSPVRNALEDYINTLNMIPRSIGTEVALQTFTPKQGARGARVPVMDTGGVIPGSRGEPVPMIGHAGEVVLNEAQQRNVADALRGGGGPDVVHVHLNIDGREIDNMLVRLKRRDGSLGFERV